MKVRFTHHDDWRIGDLSYRRDSRKNIRGFHGVWTWWGRPEKAVGPQPDAQWWTMGPFRFRLSRYTNGRMWFDVWFRHRTI